MHIHSSRGNKWSIVYTLYSEYSKVKVHKLVCSVSVFTTVLIVFLDGYIVLYTHTHMHVKHNFERVIAHSTATAVCKCEQILVLCSPQTCTSPEPAKSKKTNFTPRSSLSIEVKRWSKVAVNVPLQVSYGDHTKGPGLTLEDQKIRARLG